MNELAVEKPRVRVKAGSMPVATATDVVSPRHFVARPVENSPFLAGFMPALREGADTVAASWKKQAARVVSAYQNSGFVRGVIDVSTAQVAGSGLRMSSQPDAVTLGWTPKFAAEFARKREASFQAWSTNPYHCDASGQFNFGMLQQAYYWLSMAYGEGLALIHLIDRPGSKYQTKAKLLPPSRIVDYTDGVRWVQGVRVDADGMPIAIRLRAKDGSGMETEKDVSVRTPRGQLRVIRTMMPVVAQTRSISDVATGMKAYRQFDQYSDANLAQKMIRSIFAAVIKSNLSGVTAFEGLMTEGDQLSAGALDLGALAGAKGQFYDGAQINMGQHGRIAHLFPTDELDFVESRAAGDEFDPIARWLWLEIAAAAGVTYESATGDYRGATYSSVRMGGAKEWLNVMRRREGVLQPFCQTMADAVLEEDIAMGRIEIPGGLDAFYEQKEAICNAKWPGPRQPQADDFKQARSHQVLKEMGATTLAAIAADYGIDYDDMMRQQALENSLADELKLPRPWAPTDPLQTKEGQALELEAPADGEQERKDRPTKPRKGGVRNPGDEEDRDDSALDAELEAELEAGAGE